MADELPFRFRFRVRYGECDAQGVVFNGHYLTWFDEACTGYLDHIGVTYPQLMSAGYDFQVVHSEIDFVASVRWRDEVRVTARCTRVGTTSFTIGFDVSSASAGSEERVAVRGHNVYVVVSTEERALPAAWPRLRRRSPRRTPPPRSTAR